MHSIILLIVVIVGGYGKILNENWKSFYIFPQDYLTVIQQTIPSGIVSYFQ